MQKSAATDPHGIVGKEVPAKDGGNYGQRILKYLPDTKDYLVQAITWDTGEPKKDPPITIDEFKITYRYDLSKVRLQKGKLF